MLVLALKANCAFHLLSKSIPINDAVNRGPYILHKQQKIMENVNYSPMNFFCYTNFLSFNSWVTACTAGNNWPIFHGFAIVITSDHLLLVPFETLINVFLTENEISQARAYLRRIKDIHWGYFYHATIYMILASNSQELFPFHLWKHHQHIKQS